MAVVEDVNILQFVQSNQSCDMSFDSSVLAAGLEVFILCQ